MKVVQISYSVNPSTSCVRLGQALRKEGIRIKILTMETNCLGGDISDDTYVIKPSPLFGIYKWLCTKFKNFLLRVMYPYGEKPYFSVGNLGIPYRYIRKLILDADVVHIHWAIGMINYSNIRKICRDAKKVVWTVHDCWLFLGGFHHDTGKYSDDEHIYGSHHVGNLIRKITNTYILNKKRRYFDRNIILIAPSSWMKERLVRSEIFKDNRIEQIPNALDTEKFRVLDRRIIRDKYEIPQDKRVILTGAVDMRSPFKGYDLLKKILSCIGKDEFFDNSMLLTFGHDTDESDLSSMIETRALGYINCEDMLCEIYNLADVFILPSVNENLPTVVMESMSCGTPVTAFDVGGIGDMIDHEYNGYIATSFDVDDFIKGIRWCLDSFPSRQKLHEAMEKFCSSKRIAEMHVKLYRE